jgi:GT2 family glycosyltransferase
MMRGHVPSDRAERAGGAHRQIVSAITVMYHTGPVVWACLDSMLDQPELRELIVVINGAADDVRARLMRRATEDGRIRLIDPGKNVGFAPGCNLGASAASGELLAFINPDCNLSAGTLAAVRDVLARRPKAWLVGGRLEHPSGREQRGGRRDFMTPWRAFVEATRLDRLFPDHPYFKRLHLVDEAPVVEPARVPVVSGAFMVLRKSDFEQLGGMDDNFFLHVDDYDLCVSIWRAVRSGTPATSRSPTIEAQARLRRFSLNGTRRKAPAIISKSISDQPIQIGHSPSCRPRCGAVSSCWRCENFRPICAAGAPKRVMPNSAQA